MLKFCITIILLFLEDKTFGNQNENNYYKMNGTQEWGNYLYKNQIIENFRNSWPVEDWKSNGFFIDDDIYEINIHWLVFSPPSNAVFTILGVTYMVLMIVGITGNVLVIFLYMRCKTLRTQGNALIANLAISDMLMMLKMPIFVYNSFHKGPALGDVACKIYAFLGGLTGVVSIVTLGAISLDRYFVIRFPLSRKYSKLRIKLCLFCSWLYALIFSSIPLTNIGLAKYQYEGYLISCSFDYLSDFKNDRLFILVFFFAAWLIPFALISFSYINIVQVVSGGSFPATNDKDTFRHMKEKDKQKQEIKLAVVVFAVIILWFVSWTPYAIVALLGISGNKHLITPLSSMLPAIFCKTASCIDPIIYALSHPKFKKEAMKLFSGKPVRPKERKIWSTSRTKMKERSFKADNPPDGEVEEDVIEIALNSIPMHNESMVNREDSDKQWRKQEKSVKRQNSYSKLLCLQPNFSNKSSSFRKIARRWSSIRRQRKDEEETANHELF